MTTHINATFEDLHASSAATATAIVPTHVAEGSDSQTPDYPALALARLQAFFTGRGPGFEQLFSLLDLKGAQDDLDALRELLAQPADVQRALRRAERLLDLLVDDLASVPVGTDIRRPMLAGEEAIVLDLDAWVRWHGARTQEMRNLVRHVLG